MDKGNLTICDQAIKFISDVFQIYLEKRDFSAVLSMCHRDITWIGTGEHEICRNFSDAHKLFCAEQNAWDGRFKIIDQWHKAISISEEFVVVWGEVQVIEDGLNTILLEMNSRFSMICCRENEEFKLYHAHFSVPNFAQSEDEFIHKNIVKNYNILLEQKLEERTKMLKEKTNELELLANNILGGVQVCIYDNVFTMLYVSDGFLTLTGYSREEIATVCRNEHTFFMLRDDVPIIVNGLVEQLESTNGYSVEYRIRRKNGEIIWVVDKGLIISDIDGVKKLQSIMTDITKQKRQEILLEQKGFEIETITNSIQAAIVRCDFDEKLTIKYANDGLFRMIGYTRAQFKAECHNAIGAIIHPDDTATMNANFKKQLIFGNTTVNVNRIIRRDGTDIWILVRGTVVRMRGNMSEFRGVLTDITEQKNIEDKLRISEKRYEIAMGFSDVTMFEYNVITKKLTIVADDAEMYGIDTIIPDGPETLIKRGIIDPYSAGDYREMYRKIHAGELTAQCYINMKDNKGVMHELELKLMNIFDDDGKPISAIGVRKNVTQLNRLQKELEYGNIMAANQLLIYEINITRDKIVSINDEWAQEYGMMNAKSFSEMKEIIGKTVIDAEHRDILTNILSKESIIKAFENGQKLITYDYREKTVSEAFKWFRKNVNIVRDSITGDINIRSYIVDITDEKIKESKAIDEKRLYDNLRVKDVVAYEVNVTKNLALSGYREWGKFFGIEPTNNFTDMVNSLVHKSIHTDDKLKFSEIYERENILRSYADGIIELICEYRRYDESGNFVWVRCTMHLFAEPQTTDVKAYAYIENIDAMKQKELELIYRSEHDALTGLFNKATTEKVINEFLATAEGKIGTHAFFIIDIDYFKPINDNFGHAFGDVVLSQVSTKISMLFRNIDIVGRIGGDEFIVLMKSITNRQMALNKAHEICGKLVDQYVKDGLRYKISVSIGIAFHNEDGDSYQTLYHNSDTALYVSKEDGRNRYTPYSKNMVEMNSCTNEIVIKDYLESKNVKNNLNEYVFRILFETADKTSAINSALCVIGMSYSVSRMYIFEKTVSGTIEKTFEWCDENIPTQIDVAQSLTLDEFNGYRSNFNADHIFYLHDVAKGNPLVREKVATTGTQSLLQFGIVNNGECVGFVGLDECDSLRTPSYSEINNLRSLTDVLIVFLAGMRAEEKSKVAYDFVASMINEIDNFAYVCEPNSFKILLVNDKLNSTVPLAIEGVTCYEVLANRTIPCVNCPMSKVSNDLFTSCNAIFDDVNYGERIELHATPVSWLGGQSAYLLVGKPI